jgi:hypothetical protein
LIGSAETLRSVLTKEYAATGTAKRVPRLYATLETERVPSGDSIEALIESYRSLGDNTVTAWKLDRLLDIVAIDDSRIVDFLLEVVADQREPIEVRREVLNRLRGGSLGQPARTRVAQAAMRLLSDDPRLPVRLEAAIALGDWTDVPGVVAVLAQVARDEVECFELRYATFASIERSGPTSEAIAALRALVSDDLLGRTANNMLRAWHAGLEPC